MVAVASPFEVGGSPSGNYLAALVAGAQLLISNDTVTLGPNVGSITQPMTADAPMLSMPTSFIMLPASS